MSSLTARPVAALVLGLVVAIAACSSKESKFARHVERAKEFETNGQLKEALLELRSALQVDPKNPDVNLRIAELLAKGGQFADAAFFYRETTRLDPTRSDAALAEAKLILFDDTARAEELTERVLASDPKNVTAYVRRSEIALARANSADALAAALTATELEPNDGLANMQLGIVHLARLREHALKGEPTPQAVYEDAERSLKRAAELFPHGINPRIELGQLYLVWPGREAQAEASYRSAMEVADTDTSKGRAANAAVNYARQVNNQEFLRSSIKSLLDVAPNELDAWQIYAEAEERREPGAGKAVYAQMLEKRPQDINAHIQYAGFLYGRKEYDTAFAHMQEQVDAGLEPAIALDHIVALRLRRNEHDEARAARDRLVKDFPQAPRTELAKGRVALAENRVDEAAESLRRYIGMEDTAEGQQLLARAELRRGSYPTAIAAIDRAIALEPDAAVESLRVKATIHAATNDHAQTLQTLNRIQSAAGVLQPREKLLYSQTLYAMGRRPAAKALLEELLASEEPLIEAVVEFAQREGPREPDRARGYLEQALQRQPRHPQALRLMAQFELGAGRPADALARIDKAAESKPLTPSLLLLRAQVLASQKDWARAEEEARRAFAAAPTLPGALDLLANIYVAQNRVDEAIASFQEAEKAGALPASGQQLLARLYLTAGRNAEAKPLYEKALAARADLPGAKNDLAWILASEGTDLERAFTLAQEAQQAEPESPEIADTLGFVYLKRGLDDPALQQFEYAIELAERRRQADRPEYHYHMGLALKALGRSAEATAAFERALALDAKFANADDARRQLEAAKAGAAGPG